MFFLAQPYDLTDRDSVRQLLHSQKQHMKQLDSALGDALADFTEEEEDLVIDEKPIKLKLNLGSASLNTANSSPKTPQRGNKLNNKKPLTTLMKQTSASVRSKASEDLNMTKVHQDDEYIYPSLELSDDEMDVGPTVNTSKDDAWTPKVKVRGTLPAGKIDRAARDRSKKVAAVEAGLKQAAEKRRKVAKLKKKQPVSQHNDLKTLVTPKQVLPGDFEVQNTPTTVKTSSLLMNTPASASSTLESVKLSLSKSAEMSAAASSAKKPKKGFGTAKQRLGKILKLKF